MEEEAKPKPITKQVNKHVSTAVDVANFTWKLLRMTKQLEFAVVTGRDINGRAKTKISHTVQLTDNEILHLDKGGKIIVVHLCGYQPHIKL
jgi:hypothetical protein